MVAAAKAEKRPSIEPVRRGKGMPVAPLLAGPLAAEPDGDAEEAEEPCAPPDDAEEPPAAALDEAAAGVDAPGLTGAVTVAVCEEATLPSAVEVGAPEMGAALNAMLGSGLPSAAWIWTTSVYDSMDVLLVSWARTLSARRAE